jgi:hypothetical protein
MSQKTDWLIPDRLVLVQAWDQLSLDELRAINSESNALISAGTPMVHMIVDVTRVRKFPTNLREINAATRTTSPGQYGWTAMVTSNAVIRFVASVAVHAAGARVRMFEDAQAALRFLYEQDASLPQPVPAIPSPPEPPPA